MSAVRALLALSFLLLALLVPATAASAATCDDYATQEEAQAAADTRDADGDGLYCESLPSGGGAGDAAEEEPAESVSEADPTGEDGPQTTVDPDPEAAERAAAEVELASARVSLGAARTALAPLRAATRRTGAARTAGRRSAAAWAARTTEAQDAAETAQQTLAARRDAARTRIEAARTRHAGAVVAWETDRAGGAVLALVLLLVAAAFLLHARIARVVRGLRASGMTTKRFRALTIAAVVAALVLVSVISALLGATDSTGAGLAWLLLVAYLAITATLVWRGAGRPADARPRVRVLPRASAGATAVLGLLVLAAGLSDGRPPAPQPAPAELRAAGLAPDPSAEARERDIAELSGRADRLRAAARRATGRADRAARADDSARRRLRRARRTLRTAERAVTRWEGEVQDLQPTAVVALDGPDDEGEVPVGDVDCGELSSQVEAYALLAEDPSDPNGLDADGDGEPCETLP